MKDPLSANGPVVTCEQVAAWASAYLDDHIGGEEKVRVVLHLAVCAGCDAYVKQIAAVGRVVAGLVRLDPLAAPCEQLRLAFAARTMSAT